MANLLLLRELLPVEYQVEGSPHSVIVHSPFKTPLGQVEVKVKDEGDKFIVENDDLAYKAQVMGTKFNLKRFKDFTELPVKFEENRIYVEVSKENKPTDLIKLAKTVDSLLKDIYDFSRSLSIIPDIQENVGGLEGYFLQQERMKQIEKKIRKRQAGQIKADITMLYDTVKRLVEEANRALKSNNLDRAQELLMEIRDKERELQKLLREYEEATGKKIFGFQMEILRNSIAQLETALDSLNR
ncbi:MAG: hypothetical protein GXN97_05465 [Aquificae bacterium]|nr:hypothetical protein [Aquificota bacterium]